MVKIPVSIGEIVDKITILLIKKEKIPEHIAKICQELDLLKEEIKNFSVDPALINELQYVNNQLWEVEDLLREKEKIKSFDDAFIELARSVYKLNDRRSVLKKQINQTLNSEIQEFKSYK